MEKLGPETTHYCPIFTPYRGRKRAEFGLRQYGLFRGIFKWAFKGCAATVPGLYSPLGHWRWPQAQNASQPTTTLDSPSHEYCCLSDHWEWGCFHGSGKNIDNKVHIYWTTWYIELELPWQVRLIQKLHFDWNSTHVSPKRRQKQWTPVNSNSHLADDNDQVVRPAHRRPTNTGPSRGVIHSS